MPSQKRQKTKYPGVYFIEGTSGGSNKTERIYYIMYRDKNKKQVHEKAGRQFQDDMTPAKAAGLRARKIDGDLTTNREKRTKELEEKRAAENRWTIRRLWKEYRANKPNLKGLTTDVNRFDNYIDGPFGDREPAELISLDIDRLRVKLLKKKAPATVKNILELLRRIINFGVKKNLCARPNFIIEMPQLNNEKTEDLTPHQLSALLQAIEIDQNQKAAKIMKSALYTGMRRGELFRLQWNDIDFKTNTIFIRDPKGGKDEKIPLNTAAKKLFKSITKTHSPYVFPGKNGNQLVDIKNAVNRIKNNARLPKEFRALHGLRHVYASMLASSGEVDLYTLQRLLTHKSPIMTQRYAHLRDETLQKASNIAGSIIDKALKLKEDNIAVNSK